MGKYLFQGSYTEQGLKGLLKDGGSGRLKAVDEMFRGLGGKLEIYYWSYGSDDFFIVAELPDSKSAIGGSLLVNATGAVKVRTTVLITAEELDQACQVTINYRPPGQ